MKIQGVESYLMRLIVHSEKKMESLVGMVTAIIKEYLNRKIISAFYHQKIQIRVKYRHRLSETSTIAS